MDQITVRDETIDCEARDREDAADSLLKLGRRVADFGPEPCAERAEAFVADGETDFGDGRLLAGEEFLGSIDAHPREKFVRRLAECARKEAMVVIPRKTRFAGGIGEAERLIESGGEKIARLAEATE